MTTVSVIIPAFNRVEPLKQTLRSAARALQQWGQSAEILLIDDGSSPPLSEQLEHFQAGWPVTHLRQSNQGSIVARQKGLFAAQGEYLLFLDSDDLVPPEKIARQVDGLIREKWDVVYGDMAVMQAADAPGEATFTLGETLRRAADAADFFLRVQPAPHNPMYRRDYLLRHLASPTLPARRSFDAAGDVWLYYNLCQHPASIGKLDTPVAAIGLHGEDRYSRQWEKLGLAALGVMKAFAEQCPKTPETVQARTAAGECAFGTWRRLPRGFDRDFTTGALRLWRDAPRGPLERLGGTIFQSLARVVGAERAGRIMRLRNASYTQVRTLSDSEYKQVFPR